MYKILFTKSKSNNYVGSFVYRTQKKKFSIYDFTHAAYNFNLLIITNYEYTFQKNVLLSEC